MDQAYCDALRFAIEYEQKGEQYYREAAAGAQDHLAVKALLFLADEEVEHIRKIEEFNSSLLDQTDFDFDRECALSLPERVDQFIAAAKALTKPSQGPILTDIAVYDLAMAAEKEGFEMYAAAGEELADERLKRFFRFLAAEEVAHHGLLAASKKYLEDPSYYFEEAGGWIFG